MKKALLSILILHNIVSGHLFSNEVADKVVFLDIGAGDSTLIKYYGLNIFIDGGPSDNLIYELDGRIDNLNPKIDIFFLTHLHEDHLSGLEEVLNHYTVKTLIVPNICGIQNRLQYLSKLSVSNFKIIEANSNNMISISKDFSIEVLYPYLSADLCIEADKNENNNSLVLRMDIRGKSFLFMGDAEKEVEKWLISNSYDEISRIDILKAGHHCSDTSNTKNFILVTDPKITICSTSKDNSYGHPSEAVVKAFIDNGTRVYKTYEFDDGIVIEL